MQRFKLLLTYKKKVSFQKIIKKRVIDLKLFFETRKKMEIDRTVIFVLLVHVVTRHAVSIVDAYRTGRRGPSNRCAQVCNAVD